MLSPPSPIISLTFRHTCMCHVFLIFYLFLAHILIPPPAATNNVEQDADSDMMMSQQQVSQYKGRTQKRAAIFSSNCLNSFTINGSGQCPRREHYRFAKELDREKPYGPTSACDYEYSVSHRQLLGNKR